MCMEYVCSMFVWYVCISLWVVGVHRAQRRASEVLFHHYLLYSLRKDFLLNPELDWQSVSPSGPPVSATTILR